MPLDPRAQTYVEKIASLGQPAIHEQLPQEARKQMLDGTAALGKPPAIHSVRDMLIDVDVRPLPARIYRPNDEPRLPMIVFFHGGGWVIGSIETHDALCRSLANATGCAVASIEYRLAPEYKYPTAAEDAYAATKWFAANADRFDVDATKIIVAGDSAGGNLAAVTALMARDRKDPHVAMQILIYPITNFDFDTASYDEFATGYMLGKKDMLYFWDHYLTRSAEGYEPYASPLRASDLRNLPPALVITAECDPLCDEGEAYARKLIDAGNQVTLSSYNGMIHGFLRRPLEFPQADAALHEISDEIRWYLQPQPA